MNRSLAMAIMAATVLALVGPAAAQDRYEGVDPEQPVCVQPEGCGENTQYLAVSGGAAVDPEEPVCAISEGCDGPGGRAPQYGGTGEETYPEEPVRVILEGCPEGNQYGAPRNNLQEGGDPASQDPTPPTVPPKAVEPPEDPVAGGTSTSSGATAPDTGDEDPGSTRDSGGPEIAILPNTGGASGLFVAGMLLVSLGVLARAALR